jgi:molybdopterin-containing oxidoreductase family iron-sulfur binding subunit
MMDMDRRSFLKDSGCAALGVGCGLPLLGTACSAGHGHGGEGEAQPHQWAMVIDIEKCKRPDIRQACAEACHRVHNVPDIPETDDRIHWIWTEGFENTFPDQVHAHTAPELKDAPVLVLCNHCSRPPCVKVCPTGATWKRDSDGIVMMDMHRCIGCRYCMVACPYGSRSFNFRDPREFLEMDADGLPPSNYPTRTKGVVEKCSFCAERIRVGGQPACVEAVNALPEAEGALTFGDLGEPDSEVNKILREKHTICRRVGLGTGPNVYYIV